MQPIPRQPRQPIPAKIEEEVIAPMTAQESEELITPFTPEENQEWKKIQDVMQRVKKLPEPSVAKKAWGLFTKIPGARHLSSSNKIDSKKQEVETAINEAERLINEIEKARTDISTTQGEINIIRVLKNEEEMAKSVALLDNLKEQLEGQKKHLQSLKQEFIKLRGEIYAQKCDLLVQLKGYLKAKTGDKRSPEEEQLIQELNGLYGSFSRKMAVLFQDKLLESDVVQELMEVDDSFREDVIKIYQIYSRGIRQEYRLGELLSSLSQQGVEDQRNAKTHLVARSQLALVHTHLHILAEERSIMAKMVRHINQSIEQLPYGDASRAKLQRDLEAFRQLRDANDREANAMGHKRRNLVSEITRRHGIDTIYGAHLAEEVGEEPIDRELNDIMNKKGWTLTPWAEVLTSGEYKGVGESIQGLLRNSFVDTINTLKEEIYKIKRESGAIKREKADLQNQVRESEDIVARLQRQPNKQQEIFIHTESIIAMKQRIDNLDKKLETLRIEENHQKYFMHQAILKRTIEVRSQMEKKIKVKQNEMNENQKRLSDLDSQIKENKGKLLIEQNKYKATEESLASLWGESRTTIFDQEQAGKRQERLVNSLRESRAKMSNLQATIRGLEADLDTNVGPQMRKQIEENAQFIKEMRRETGQLDQTFDKMHHSYVEETRHLPSLGIASAITQEAKGMIAGVLHKISALGYVQEHVSPEQLRRDKDLADQGYSMLEQIKKLMNDIKIPQGMTIGAGLLHLLNTVPQWAENNPEIASSIAADLALVYSQISNENAFQQFVTRLRVKTYSRMLLERTGKPQPALTKEEQDRRAEEALKYQALADLAHYLPFLNALVKAGTSIKDLTVVEFVKATAQAGWELTKVHAVMRAGDAYSLDDARTTLTVVQTALDYMKGDVAESTIGEQETQEYIEHAVTAYNLYKKPKSTMQRIGRDIKHWWNKIWAAPTKKERWLRFFTQAVIPATATIIGIGVCIAIPFLAPLSVLAVAGPIIASVIGGTYKLSEKANMAFDGAYGKEAEMNVRKAEAEQLMQEHFGETLNQQRDRYMEILKEKNFVPEVVVTPNDQLTQVELTTKDAVKKAIKTKMEKDVGLRQESINRLNEGQPNKKKMTLRHYADIFSESIAKENLEMYIREELSKTPNVSEDIVRGMIAEITPKIMPNIIAELEQEWLKDKVELGLKDQFTDLFQAYYYDNQEDLKKYWKEHYKPETTPQEDFNKRMAEKGISDGQKQEIAAEMMKQGLISRTYEPLRFAPSEPTVHPQAIIGRERRVEQPIGLAA